MGVRRKIRSPRPYLLDAARAVMYKDITWRSSSAVRSGHPSFVAVAGKGTAIMTWHYAYTPHIWPSAVTILLLIVLAAYSWRRRSTPGALPLAISCLLAVLIAVGEFMTYLAVDDKIKFFWGRFGDIWILPSTTAVTCFILEYAWPGRWLTRRNLGLLSVAPLLGAFYILTGDFFGLIPNDMRGSGPVLQGFGQVGGVLFIYSLVLALVNFSTFVWLFIRSPQHRWPVIIMATGQIVTRVLILRSSPELDARLLYLPDYVFGYLSYAIALFGFRLFDPIPLARQTALNQIRAGMLVLDRQGRVVSLNPSAEQILGLSTHQAKGISVNDLLPSYLEAPAAIQNGAEFEFSLGNGRSLRNFSMAISPLKDFRALEVGRLLMLRDVTEKRRAQAQILEQGRSLATMLERERLARELHDSIGQVLSYAALQVETTEHLIAGGRAGDAQAQLRRLGSVLGEAHADVRQTILDLRAAPSPQRPFFEVVQHYLNAFTTNYDIETALTVGDTLGDTALLPTEQAALFRILQEALSNARRHARACAVQVAFGLEDGLVRMSIEDNGCGMEPDRLAAFERSTDGTGGASHFGLDFMRERARELGGVLRIESAAGAGTRVVVEIPQGEG